MSITLKILLLFVTPYKCMLATNYFENSPENWPKFEMHRNAMKMEQYKWPNGIIPYEFSDEYTVQEVKSVYDAMQSFHRETCIRFIPKSKQVESIRFVKAKGCGAQIGFRKNRSEPMPVMYDAQCLKIAVALQHELFHVTGLFHEHNRPDRDEYLQVFYENVDEKFKDNFIKGSFDYMETFGLPYDYKSIMHYPRNAFAKQGANFTMLAKIDPDMELGQREAPTPDDWEKVRRMYVCDNQPSRAAFNTNNFN